MISGAEEKVDEVEVEDVVPPLHNIWSFDDVNFGVRVLPTNSCSAERPTVHQRPVPQRVAHDSGDDDCSGEVC